MQDLETAPLVFYHHFSYVTSADKKPFNTVGYNFSEIKIKTPILPEISELCHLSSRQSVASQSVVLLFSPDSPHGWIKIPRLSQKPPAPPPPDSRHSPNSALKYLCVFARQYELWNQ